MSSPAKVEFCERKMVSPCVLADPRGNLESSPKELLNSLASQMRFREVWKPRDKRLNHQIIRFRRLDAMTIRGNHWLWLD